MHGLYLQVTFESLSVSLTFHFVHFFSFVCLFVCQQALSVQGVSQLCQYVVYGREIFQQPLGVDQATANRLTQGLPSGITVPEIETLDSDINEAVQGLARQSKVAEHYVRGLFLGLPSEYDLEVLADNEYANGIIALAGVWALICTSKCGTDHAVWSSARLGNFSPNSSVKMFETKVQHRSRVFSDYSTLMIVLLANLIYYPEVLRDECKQRVFWKFVNFSRFCSLYFEVQ